MIVNCARLGAGELAADDSVRPIRGQHVVVKNPGITEFFSEDTGLSPDLVCIYPHGETVVLGGTAIDGEAGLQEDPATARRSSSAARQSNLGWRRLPSSRPESEHGQHAPRRVSR
ncbi:hypothetical protein [Streptomyces sp. NPDC005423]|uniref:hypothetical protein n=1 Tax=Streptomyces sp. NPDC005423 TaxID=3155343 RepID=UPI0033A763B8